MPRTVTVGLIETTLYGGTFTEAMLAKLLRVPVGEIMVMGDNELAEAVNGTGIVEEILQRSGNVDGVDWVVTVQENDETQK